MTRDPQPVFVEAAQRRPPLHFLACAFFILNWFCFLSYTL